MDRHMVTNPRDVTSTLREFQAATGQSQRLHQVVYPTPSSPQLGLVWSKATIEASDGAWHLLPEEVFDLIDDEDLELDEDGGRFLGFAAMSPDTPNPAAIAAIRLLGMLAEEEALSQSHVLPILRDVLGHDDAQRRYYAAKAL